MTECSFFLFLRGRGAFCDDANDTILVFPLGNKWSRTPSDMFQGSGAKFTMLGRFPDPFVSHHLIQFPFLPETGFEYWSDPGNRQHGVINWQVNGGQTFKSIRTCCWTRSGHGRD